MDLAGQALERLSIHFGHSQFRVGQAEAMNAVLAGRDSLVVMPTGGGKSLCYQLPATMLSGITLVVSPLIALMKDQVDSLNRAAIPAVFINSTLSSAEIARRTASVGRDGVKLVYVAPERFRSPDFVEAISRAGVSLIAIDEAHCVSHWGHDFRPEYLKLGEAAEALGRPPVMALTATATDRVRQDISQKLRLRDPAIFVTGFDRPNLKLGVIQTGGDKDKLSILKARLAGLQGTGIIYAATRRSVEQITSRLKVAGLSVEAYHAGLPEAVRTEVQESFTNGRLQSIVATNAFGMGIDKRDIRFVIHYHLPGSIEAYYQEVGRAGRDGNAAECILLFNFADTRFQRLFIEGTHPSPDLVVRTLDALKRAASSSTGKDLSPADIARDLGVKREGSVRSALNVLEKAQLVRWGDWPPSSSIVSLAVPPEVALDRLPDSTREGLLLRHLIFECEIAGREAEVGEEGLATRLGVTPPSVRDSISRLAGLGVIHSRRPDLQATPRLLDLGESDRLKAERLSAEIAELSERLSAEHLKSRQMVEYCYHRRCRRLFILHYFGDSGKVSPCGECSNCKPPEEAHSFVPASKRKGSMRDREESTGTLVINAPAGVRMASIQRRTDSKARSAGSSGHFVDLASTEAWRVTAGGSSAGPHEYANRARLSLGARLLTDTEWQIARHVLECVSRFNGRFGKGTIAAVLAGSDSLEIRTHRLNNSPGFGTLTGLSVPEINSFIRSLIEANCIAVCSGGYPTIGLTALGREVMRGRVVELHI